MKIEPVYDAVIAGAGHNGLIAACYLAMGGLRVLVLEKRAVIGGATHSEAVFPGIDARLSVYSYLVSLLPQKILTDLGIRFETLQRVIASYTPVERGGQHQGLLISNVSEAATRESFRALTGSDAEYERYREMEALIAAFARRIWPTYLEPLRSREAMRAMLRAPEERKAWDYLVERPLSALIEDHLQDDAVRGMVFTDAKIGVLTWSDDPSLLQNRTFLYHVTGQGTGIWRVPRGGMGALVDALHEKALSLGVHIQTSAEVVRVEHSPGGSGVYFRLGDQEAAVKARWVLFNTSSDVVNRCLPGAFAEEQVEGSVLKMNMVLRRLPAVKGRRVSAREAFAGTLHIDEGYEQMRVSYQNALGAPPAGGFAGAAVPGEMYCHSLTDPSILSPELQAQGFHTLTLFGLDVPYHWFTGDNESVKAALAGRYLDALNCYLEEDVRDCLAFDANGRPCLDVKSPLDLERDLSLPRGNIFHGSLTWPFSENEDETGAWGVETNYKNVLICGSSARRGGAVSGIPGHNAAMKVLSAGGNDHLT